MSKMYYSYFTSPLGNLLLAGNGDALNILGFADGKARRRHESGWQRDDAAFADTMTQLSQYFSGERVQFDLKLQPIGTEFQCSVWRALQHIPFGHTVSYGELAKTIGKPTASRAVGAANGLNPIPIIIPCHRVIGSTGKLTGFGGGLAAKKYLLELEAEQQAPSLF